MNIIEHLRKKVITELFELKSFNTNWDFLWKEEILKHIKNSGTYTTTDLLNLGDNLASVFTTAKTTRSQSGVSSAGTTWEALVCWYLNLCLINTRVIVIKQKKSNVPTPISDALTVLYGSSASNTEADLIAIVFPEKDEYTSEIEDLNNFDIFNSINLFNKRSKKFNYLEPLNILVDRDSNEINLNVIQCKTNWNDNAQIPMLWDMIYRAKGFHDNNITVGQNTYSLDSFNKFSYSFVTVPTVKLPKIKPNSICVKRVITLSGGNYWGHPTKNNVANSIKEIFTRNFSSGINPNIRTTLNNSLQEIETTFSYFNLKD